MQPSDYEITNGYVSDWGVSYATATHETLHNAIAAAVVRNGKSEAAIVAALEAGDSVAWCNSPNYTYDHGTGYIRRKRAVKPAQLVRCFCGHSVEPALVMNTSRGTSCPDCCDRMSD